MIGMKPTPLDIQNNCHPMKIVYRIWNTNQMPSLITVVLHNWRTYQDSNLENNIRSVI